MAQAARLEVRIYCICGQKMKVSAGMLGRNGKCVACRQKIRIPRADELPADGGPVYLKDRKEFLRRMTPRPKTAEPAEEPAEGDELALAGEGGAVPAAPLDALDPLQRLCSLEHKLHRHFEGMRQGGAKSAAGHDKATLMRYRALVRQARAALDDELRARLLETSEQLSEAVGELSRILMALRLGELSPEAYYEQAAPLRQRRERLERRQQNLRGWLATEDAWVAGGPIDVALEEVPIEMPEIVFTLDPSGPEPLLQGYLGRLRSALTARDEAERRAAELRRMQDEGGLDLVAGAGMRAENAAAQTRARTAAAYYRARIEQLQQEFEQEHHALQAHLEALRVRMMKGELDRREYQRAELGILQAQRELGVSRELARRALQAGAPGEVPYPGKALFQRFRGGGPARNGADYYLTLMAAVLLMANIVAPISSAQSGGNRLIEGVVVAGLFVTAMLLAMVAHVARRDLRGVLVNAIWAVFCCATAYHLVETWHGTGPVGSVMRTEPRWYLAPGVLLLGVSALAIGAAATASLWPVRGMRRVPVAAALAIAAALAALFTGLGGLRTARPTVLEPAYTAQPGRFALYDVTVPLSNPGWRPYWVGSTYTEVPAPYGFMLEQRDPALGWRDVGRPAEQAGPDRFEVPPRGSAALRYALPPGDYRARLLARAPGAPDIERYFSLAAPPPGEAPLEPPPPIETPAPPETPPPPPQALAPEPQPAAPPEPIAPPDAAPPAAAPETELLVRGVIDAGGRAPRFVVEVHTPNGETSQRSLGLGDPVYGPWKAIEYNPGRGTLTIGDGNRLLVLESGEPVTVPARPIDQPL